MKNFVFAVLLSMSLSGCETIQVQTRSSRAALTEDQRISQENQRRLAGRIETLEMEIGQLNRDLEILRKQLDVRCAAIEQKSEADKREMVARLSGELDKLMKQASKVSAPAPVSNRGIEHVVQTGETLYIICKAYGVSAQTVIDVNKIKDPGKISVGQKLFIPQ
ncbi:MAG: LysM peptidoglycan-binding domain-containing protein [Pontiellaceae bacterium]|nr:LysM peptidoglycan-binding domain-containing protein [Pontiellaceae bacterium]